MKNKKAIILILSILAVVALTIFIFIPKIDHSNYVSLINHNWDLEMPYCDEEVYYVDDNDSSPLGDGDRYSILKYEKSKKINRINKMKWSDNLTTDDQNMVIKALEILDVPQEKKIDFSEDLLYLIADRALHDKLIMAYDKEKKLIYVFERFY